MFFLLRLTFWIGLVLVLLPTDNKPAADSPKLPEISAGDAMSAAASAVSDFSQFCTRNPQTCAGVGGQAAEVIGHRAREARRRSTRSSPTISPIRQVRSASPQAKRRLPIKARFRRPISNRAGKVPRKASQRACRSARRTPFLPLPRNNRAISARSCCENPFAAARGLSYRR